MFWLPWDILYILLSVVMDQQLIWQQNMEKLTLSLSWICDCVGQHYEIFFYSHNYSLKGVYRSRHMVSWVGWFVCGVTFVEQSTLWQIILKLGIHAWSAWSVQCVRQHFLCSLVTILHRYVPLDQQVSRMGYKITFSGWLWSILCAQLSCVVNHSFISNFMYKYLCMANPLCDGCAKMDCRLHRVNKQ